MTSKTFIIFIICFVCSFIGTRSYITYFTPPPPVELHVYMDTATGPAFLQMIDFIKRPKTKKIIAWYFFQEISSRINLESFNAIEINYYQTSFRKRLDMLLNQTLKEINQALTENPNTRLVFHTNVYYAGYLLNPLLEHLNKTKVKHIYLYEDGYGNTAGSKKLLYTDFNPLKIPDNIWNETYAFYMHQRYPTTYNIAFAKDIFQDPQLQNLTNFIGPYIKNVDFNEIIKNLTLDEKQVLANLVGFPQQKWHEKFKNCSRPNVILLGPHPQNETEQKRQIKLFSDILSNTDYCWFFKPHPSPFAQNFTNELKKRFPKLEIIDASIPAEIFLLTDTMPDFIAGYSSSVFYAMPKEKILFYISRPHDTYLDLLLKKEIVSAEKIIYLNDPEHQNIR